MVNRRKANRRNNMQLQLAALRTQVKGRVVVPPFDPPQIVDIPWNTLTCSFAGASTQTVVKVSDLEFNITDQLLLFGSVSGTAWRASIEYRLQEVRVWATNQNVSLDVTIYDPTNADSGTFTSLRDRGTITRPARVGYIFPAIMSQNTLRGSTEGARNIISANVEAGVPRFYFRCLWRPY